METNRTETISVELMNAISFALGIKPRAAAVRAFFKDCDLENDGSLIIVRHNGFDEKKLEEIKWTYSVHREVEKRIYEAEIAKENDDFFFMEHDDYEPKELIFYVNPVRSLASLKDLDRKIEKYNNHIAKDEETISKSKHPEKYYSRRYNHITKRDRARFERDVEIALAKHFGIEL